MQTSSFVLLFIQCLYALVSTDDHDRARRDLSMLRMGKRALGMLRMGRSSKLPPLVPPAYEFPDDELNERDVTYDIFKYEDERAPPLPRLGQYLNEIRRELGEEDEEVLRQLWTIPRVGRYLALANNGRHKRSTDEQVAEQHDVAKRDVGDEDEERSVVMPRLGLYDRAVPKPRLGLYDRALPFPRLGVREDSTEEDNVIDNNSYDKRAMGMLRMGRSDGATEEEKRAMGMLRMGRGLSMLRMGKRAMGMLRMGRSDPAQEEEEKRAMGMLRMGKRAMGMLRMGRSDGSEYNEEEKRAMGMLRMGKRAMGMLRMGRSSADEEKRAMGMLRMGRGMSMLRMGKREDETTGEEKRAMGMLRMGKRSS